MTDLGSYSRKFPKRIKLRTTCRSNRYSGWAAVIQPFLKKALKSQIVLVFYFFPLLGITGQESKPNIVVFIADDISWDDFGCYGNSVVQTPNIDALAASGIKFTNFYLTASSCSPSRNSILTGRYPHNTGAAELHTEPPIDMLSFAELLRENNYYSVQAGKFHMGEYARRGFDKTIEKLEQVGDGGEAMWVSAMQERPRNKPFFMWFAAYDAHRNWGPNPFSGTHDPNTIVPPPYLSDDVDTRSDMAKYYDEITRFDFYIGEVVKELEQQQVLNNTLLIVMADNGRPFPHSKTRLNDRGMKSPLIVYWPSVTQSGTACHSLVSAIDIAPTLMHVAGIPPSEQFQGHSFEKLIKAPNSEFRNYVFAEHNWHDYEAHGRMVRIKDFMYILNSRPWFPQIGPADAVSSPSHKALEQLKQAGKLSAIQADIFVVPRPEEELYDYSRDPGQLLNVASHPEYQETLISLRATLQEWMQETGDNIPETLTKDWYRKEAGYIKTEFHNVRGEMPGASLNATKINKKGKF